MINDEFRVSVIIPCYNSSSTITKCIESVRNQTFQVEEIIVIDDGSSDNTYQMLLEIKESFRHSDTSFLLLQQKNSGPSMARNKGIAKATGNWIAFLDSDDLWYNQKIEKQIDVLKCDKEIVLCGTGYGIGIVDDENVIEEVLFKRHLFKTYFSTPTILLKSSVAKGIMFDETLKYSEDYQFWLQVNYEYKCVKIRKTFSRNIENKRVFGHKGLSSELWKMEKGQLLNYIFLVKKGYIGKTVCLIACFFSFLKYLRRLIVVKA